MKQPFSSVEASAPPPTYFAAVDQSGDFNYPTRQSAPIIIQPVTIDQLKILTRFPQTLTWY